MIPVTPAQIAVLERLVEHGFHPVAFPMYASSVGIRRGAFAALLEPAEGAAFLPPTQAFYLIEGNLGVHVSRGGREWFVWKAKSVEATPALLAELAEFRAQLLELLQSPS